MISFELQDKNQLWPWWFPSLNKCTALHYGCYDIVMTWKKCLSIFTVEFCNILIFSWRKFFMFSSSGLQGESDSSEIVLGPFWRDYFCSNIYGIEFDPLKSESVYLNAFDFSFWHTVNIAGKGTSSVSICLFALNFSWGAQDETQMITEWRFRMMWCWCWDV